MKSPSRHFFASILGLFCLITFQQNRLTGQVTYKSDNRLYLDSMIQIHPDFSIPKDPNVFSLDSVPDLVGLSDNEVMRYAYQLADRAVSLENILNLKAQNMTYFRKMLERDIEEANPDLMGAGELDSLKREYKILVKKEKKALKIAKESAKVASASVAATKLEVVKMREKLPQIRNKVSDLSKTADANINSNIKEESTELSGVSTPIQKKNKKKQKAKKEEEAPTESEIAENNENNKSSKNKLKIKRKPKKEEGDISADPENTDTTGIQANTVRKAQKSKARQFKQYNPTENVMLYPPTPACTFTINQRDEFSGELHQVVGSEELFRFTNDFMKVHLKDKSHIVCDAALSTLGDACFLNLTVKINEAYAQKTFGGVAKKGGCNLKLIDGALLSLTSVKDEEGTMDETGTQCTFRLQFSLDRVFLKTLAKSELDSIRIGWRKGFEDYEIFNVDILKRQAKCLLEQ